MKNSTAWQLLSVARIEMHRPFNGARVLIAGDCKAAEDLKRLLTDEGAQVDCAENLEDADNVFELVFLLEEAENTALLPLLAKNALVIDCAPNKSGEWSVFDAKGTFRRIKVVSLLKNAV